jgi:hypothetical protein
MNPLLSINGLALVTGGQSHSGWLPSEAAVPSPTPSKRITLDLEIQSAESGYLLVYRSQDGSVQGDTWHQSIEEAQAQAHFQFGITPPTWHRPNP